ncbi:MAG: peptidylprolyl isomerase [Prevotella sp.]
MKLKLLLGVMLLCDIVSFAQSSDPVVMKVNGQSVTRSEFEYSYNKNNTEGVIDKKSIADYVPLFVAYKLKVEAAKAAKLDTMKSFQKEFADYRDQQIRPAFITDADIEAEAKKLYTQTQQQIDKNGGMVKVAHILILISQRADSLKQLSAKKKIDSIFSALKKGADFAKMAKALSEDQGSARNGGELSWIVKGQTLKEFEDAAWALKNGEISKPVRTAVGWHIILKKGHQNFYSYASQRAAIMNYINQRGLKENIIDEKLDSLAKAQHTTPDKILEAKRIEMEAQDPSLKYLIQEYHDGLLVYEISNRQVWEKAQKDSIGQENFFKKHKKNYKWEEPRFKGMAYCTRQAEDIANVQKAIKGKPFEQWANILRSTFNADSILRIRVEEGIFRKGNNALVDKQIFGKDTVATPLKDFPYTAVYGKKLNAPESVDDIRQQVISDYQEVLEKQWVNALRQRYHVEIDEKVLQTVNKH